MSKKISAPINTITRNTNQQFAPKADIILIVSCTNSNQNGDPDDEGRPRITTDNHAMMSAVSIKRKFRDTVIAYREPAVNFFGDENDSNNIFVEKASVRTQQMASVLDLKMHPELGKVVNAKESVDEKKVKSGVVSREDRAYAATKLCEHFLDVRIFGQCLGTVGAIEGAVQIENSISINPVDVDEICITASQVANGSEAATKSSTMGRAASIKFAVFPIAIHVNGIRATQNGFTRTDYERMLTILKEMFDVTNSSVRTLQFEQMIVFEHENIRGNMPMTAIRKAVKIECKEDASSMDDVNVSIDKNALNAYPGIKLSVV